MERSRTRGPELPVRVQYVKAPLRKADWIGRRVVNLQTLVTTRCRIEALTTLTISCRAVLRGAYRLTADGCESCGHTRHAIVHANDLANPRQFGFLPAAESAKAGAA